MKGGFTKNTHKENKPVKRCLTSLSEESKLKLNLTERGNWHCGTAAGKLLPGIPKHGVSVPIRHSFLQRTCQDSRIPPHQLDRTRHVGGQDGAPGSWLHTVPDLVVLDMGGVNQQMQDAAPLPFETNNLNNSKTKTKDHSYIAEGNVKWYIYVRKQFDSFLKRYTQIPYDTAIILGLHPEKGRCWFT